MYNKEYLSEYIHKVSPESKIVVSDSVVMIGDRTVTKIPQKSCEEEIFLLNIIKNAGIQVPPVVSSNEIITPLGNFRSYTMERIKSAENVIEASTDVFNPNYYVFLGDILNKFKNIKFQGYGAINLTKGTQVSTEFESKKAFFHSVIDRTTQRSNPNFFDIEIIKHNIDTKVVDDTCGQLVHSDLLNNIIFSRSEWSYYLIDPQTNTSSANEYWDLSSYLLYANAFLKTHMLEGFILSLTITNWDEFVTTAQTIAFERTAYYSRHDLSRIKPMLKFIAELNKGNILVGDKTIERSKLCQ